MKKSPLLLNEEKLNALKIKHNISSDEELCRSIGMYPTQLSNIRRDRRGVTLRMVLGLYLTFGVRLAVGPEEMYSLRTPGEWSSGR